MKMSLFLFTTAAMYFLTACNSGSENTTANRDTSTLTAASEQPSTTQDTAKSGDGLMKAMNDMMDKMHSQQMTGDFDVDFANMMIEHHQGGIDMAQLEASQGNETMKAKAQEIFTKQKQEQQQLKDFVQNYKPSGMKHGEGEMQKSMSAMMDKMKSMQMSGNVDKDFATMMSSHHEDGITMSKMELKNGMSDKLKQMAQKGINDQQKDIKEFKAWLSANNKQ